MSRIDSNGTFGRIFGNNTQLAMRTLERLATGSAINRGADDPAGLIASENFAARLSANQAEITTIQRNEAFMNIRDGALGAQLDNISDLDSMVVQASNGAGLTDAEMGGIVTQVNGALNGIDRVLPATGIDIMSDVTTQMQVGTDEGTGDPIYEEVSLRDLSRVIKEDPEAAQRLVDGARDAVLQERAQVGADQRAAEAERRVLEEEQINVARAYSSIRDADYARESSNLVRNQILGEATIAAELASRTSAVSVLRLLDIRA
ncbi:MAG: flagellin [Phycisphaerales bacterium]